MPSSSVTVAGEITIAGVGQASGVRPPKGWRFTHAALIDRDAVSANVDAYHPHLATRSGVSSACWVSGLGRNCGSVFAKFDITKLWCGQKVEHPLYQDGRRFRVVGRQ